MTIKSSCNLLWVKKHICRAKRLMAMANLAWILQVSFSNKHEISPFHSCHVTVFLPSTHTLFETHMQRTHTNVSSKLCRRAYNIWADMTQNKKENPKRTSIPCCFTRSFIMPLVCHLTQSTWVLSNVNLHWMVKIWPSCL